MKVTIVCAYNTQVDMTRQFLDVMQSTTKNFISQHNEIYMILVNGGCNEKIEHNFVSERIDLDTNEGFARTVNSGLRRVPNDTDYIFYVGNDSFPITNDWLEQLIRLQGMTNAGIVCPANDNPGMEALSHKYVESFEEYWTVGMFPSIAYLITKECFDTVGVWDERFGGPGMYGDDDYCMRTCVAGFLIIVSKHIMLRHLLSQEIKIMNVGENMIINNEKFRKKWGL